MMYWTLDLEVAATKTLYLGNQSFHYQHCLVYIDDILVYGTSFVFVILENIQIELTKAKRSKPFGACIESQRA